MRAKCAVARGGLGACPSGKFLNFKRSEINSVAFGTLFYHGKASVIAVS